MKRKIKITYAIYNHILSANKNVLNFDIVLVLRYRKNIKSLRYAARIHFYILYPALICDKLATSYVFSAQMPRRTRYCLSNVFHSEHTLLSFSIAFLEALLN